MTTNPQEESNVGPEAHGNDDADEQIQEDSNLSSRDLGKDMEGASNSYVHLVPEMHNAATNQPIPFHMTQSQKKRRKFIPFKYHSKIFKKSRKKSDKTKNHLSPVERALPQNQTHHAVQDHRVSTVSSSYASCRPHGRDVSCHTYVDIEDVVDYRDNRDMGLERCNSISTVSTLPIVTLQRPKEDNVVLENGGRGRNLDDIQEHPTTNMTPRIHYEMKAPSKTRRMKKYMILFAIVLLSVVLSTVLAGYVGTKNVVNDIPNMVEKQVQKLPSWESLQISLFNLSEGQDDFSQDLVNFKNETILINEQHLKRLEKARESDLDLIRNETKKSNDLFLGQFMNITDCVDNCTGKEEGDYQSCFTCNGFVSCSRGGELFDQDCAPTWNKPPLVWNDHTKTCESQSYTCDPSYIDLRNNRSKAESAGA